MREIRFRAWDEGGKTIGIEIERPAAMLRVIGLNFNKPKEVQCESYEKLLEGKHIINPPKYSVVLLSPPLMQSTGLKDKNGVEIFEGDILRVDWHDKRYPVHNIGPVEWDKRNACWQLGEGGTAEDDAIHNMEVIGNVWETPELMK